MKTFPFGLFLMGHISVFQLNDPKSMNFFLMSESFALWIAQSQRLGLLGETSPAFMTFIIKVRRRLEIGTFFFLSKIGD